MKDEILCCDAETIMSCYNNVEVSQYVLFDRERIIGNCFNEGKQNVIVYAKIICTLLKSVCAYIERRRRCTINSMIFMSNVIYA